MPILAVVQETASVVLFVTVSVVDFVRLPYHPMISIAAETVIAISMTDAINGEIPFFIESNWHPAIINFCKTMPEPP
jgi:hypothetical protein